MTDAYSKYKSATGGTEDSSTGLLKISSSQYNKLETLNFNIGDTGECYFARSVESTLNGKTTAHMSLEDTLGEVRFEWAGDRSVRLMIKDPTLTFST